MRTQPAPTSGRRLAALVVCMLLLGAASVGFDAATAHAAAIGPQDTLLPPRHQPVEFPGLAFAQGDPIPRGHAILRRRVGLARGERRTVRFTCPPGLVALGPALGEPSQVGFVVRDVAQLHHPGRRFRLIAFRAPRLDAAVARGRLYVMCGPRSRG